MHMLAPLIMWPFSMATTVAQAEQLGNGTTVLKCFNEYLSTLVLENIFRASSGWQNSNNWTSYMEYN